MGSILSVRNAIILLSLMVLLATSTLKAPPKSKSTVSKHLQPQTVTAQNHTLCPPLSELRIAFVTTLIGTYEHSCKEPVDQSLPVDFIAYTDTVFHSTFGANNSKVAYNKWKRVDADRYRFGLDERDRSPEDVNSLLKNQHPFNRAKVFKLNLHRLPELKGYHIVIWLDATLKIINPETAAYMVEYLCGYANVVKSHRRVVRPYARQKRFNHTVPRDVEFDARTYRPSPIVSFEHDNLRRNGLADEVMASAHLPKYSSTEFDSMAQPIQNVTHQYERYRDEGYADSFFERDGNYKPKMIDGPPERYRAVFCTALVALNMQRPETATFLNLWWQQNLVYTTQDQVSFPYVAWKLNIHPYQLPDNRIHGTALHNDLYFKTWHHQR
eukprot:gene8223-5924_t